MDTERQNKPSASGLPRLAECPGSFLLEQSLPPLPESEDAASGTRIHAALSGDQAARDSLTDDERTTYDMCESLAAQVAQAHGFGSVIPTNEKRLWAFDNSFSGKSDRDYTEGSRALVIDFKTGRNEVASAASNLQLRGLAVLKSDNRPETKDISVAIIQPWASPQVTVANYEEHDLDVAKMQVALVIEAATTEGAPRRAGSHCEFCRAKAICPEAQAKALAAIPKQNLSLATLTPEERGRRLEAADYADGVFKSWRDEAKQLLAKDPESIAGYRLKDGANKRTVSDISKLYWAAHFGMGLNMNQFLEACGVKLEPLKALYKDATKLNGKALDQGFDDFLKPHVTTTQNAPSLERVK